MNQLKQVFLFLFFVPFTAFSQEEPEPESLQSGFCLGIVPQYAISNGFRVDFDFRLNDRNHWLVVAPQVYLSNRSNLDWDYNSMVGTGIELQHKIYLKKDTKYKGAYFAYGPVFNYFSVKDNGLIAQEFVENGGNYVGLAEDEITTGIYKIGGNLIFGVNFIISDNFYFDTFIGSGFRISFDDKTTGLHDYYNEWWGDMGYSGTLMVGGFRFGVMF